MSDKIKSQHLERKAILYIRQSSAYQVSHNLESQKLQYAMQERLHQLGWREIEVVDEDLGRSAAGTVTRAGFERMVAEVCLGKVGAVAAREVSRFARNSREWQQLVEVCRVVDTVLIDQETVYTPRQSNDRLRLGLKGSLNEYELDLLRQRSVEARREKARRRAAGDRSGRLRKDGGTTLGERPGPPGTASHAVGVSQVSRIGYCPSDLVVVLGARLATSGIHPARRDGVETAHLRFDLPHSDQSDLRGRLCLWQNRRHATL